MIVSKTFNKVLSELRLSSFFISGFLILLTFAAVLVYKTNLRSDFELRFSHLKVRVADRFFPQESSDESALVIVHIDERSLINFRKKTLNEKEKPNLHFADLMLVVREIFAKKATTLTVFLPNQVFNPTDPNRDAFFSLLEQYPNLYVVNFDNPYEKIPVNQSRVWSGDLHPAIQNKTQNHQAFPLFASNRSHLDFVSAALPVAISKKGSENIQRLQECCTFDSGQFRYFKPKLNIRVPTLSLGEVVGSNASLLPKIRGKNILLGYSAYRRYTFRYNHATRVNLVQDEIFGPMEKGTPLVEAYGKSVSSVIDGFWLRDPSVFAVILLTLFCVVLVLVFSAYFDTLIFMLLSFLVYAGLFVLSVLLYVRLSVDLPVVDAVFWSSCFGFAGLHFKFRSRQRAYLKEKSFSDAIQKVYRIQKDFFEGFSQQLNTVNKDIASEAKSFRNYSKNKKISRCIEDFIMSSEQLELYLQSILKLNDLERNTVDRSYNKEDIDLFVFVDKIFRNFSVILDAKKVRFENHLPSTCVPASHTILTQIVVNIASNAAKYVDDGGAIRARYLKRQGKHVIEIWNSGSCIPESELENIFEKYYRVKDDRVYKQDGTGLGLFLSRFLGDLISAKIYVESSQERGTSFLIEWP